MKKIVFSVIFTLTTIHLLLAQITIHQENIIDLGEKVEIAILSNSSALHTAPGEDLVWDYSSLNAEQISFLEMRPPSSVEGAEYFPEATMAHFISEEAIFFYRKNNEAFDFLGVYQNFDFEEPRPTKFDPYYRLITFPSTYETSFVNEFKISQTFIDNESSSDSIVSTTETVLTATIDAWGKLSTPFGAFDVIRQNTNAEHTITYEVYENGGVLTSVVVANEFGVRFWSNDENAKYVVLEYEYNPDNLEMSSISWLNSPPILSVSSLDYPNNITVYPNPSDGKITIDGITKNQKVNVINALGKKVFSETISPLNNSLNLEMLNTGVYYINFVNDQGIAVNHKLVLK